MERRGGWLLIGAVIVGVGCSGSDDPSAVTSSTTSSTSPRSATAPSTTLSPTTSPSAVVTVPGDQREPGTTVIVASEGILGWWDGSKWVGSAGGVAVPAGGGEEYQIVRLAEPLRTRVGSAPGRGCEFAFDDNPGIDVDLGPQPTARPVGIWPVAISGVAEPRPRKVTVLQADAYRAPARATIVGLGLDPEGSDVVQVVRADLEGDGVDEVLVAVERMHDPDHVMPGPGDHSVVLLRRATEGEVTTEVVVKEVSDATVEQPSPYLLASRVAAVADLNGDGRMEVVLSQQYYEGSSTVMFEVQTNGSLKHALSVGCGV